MQWSRFDPLYHGAHKQVCLHWLLRVIAEEQNGLALTIRAANNDIEGWL